MITPVIFKKFPEGDVIAIFPHNRVTKNCFQSYQSNGRHTQCGVDLAFTLPDASQEEYIELQNELENHGAYELYILKSANQLADEFGIYGNHPEYPVRDWKYEVENGDTRLGYWAWVENMIEVNCP